MKKSFVLILLFFSMNVFAVEFYWSSDGYVGGSPAEACQAWASAHNYLIVSSVSMQNLTTYKCNYQNQPSSTYTWAYRYGDSCPSGKTYNSATGLCDTPAPPPPPACVVGQITADCPPVVCTDPAGTIGWGMTCPVTSNLHDYGCITNGDAHLCDPEYPLNAGNGTSSGSGTQEGKVGGGGTITSETGNKNINSGSNATPLGTTSGSSMSGGGSGGTSSGGFSGNSGLVPSKGSNTPMSDFCTVYPDDVACTTWTKTKLGDLCAHGGAPDPVIGCDYNYVPPTATCPAGQVPDRYGACTTPPTKTIATPPSNYVPPTTPPPPTYPSNTTTNNTTSTTTTYTNVGGATTIQVNIEPTPDNSANDCDPTASNYVDCLIGSNAMPSHTTSTPSNFSQSVSNFKNRISASPFVSSFSSIANIIPDGAGACSDFSIDLSGTPIGQVVSTSVICDLSEYIRPFIGAVMLVFYTLVAFRIVATA